ncbi:MAG: sigma-70 family RNA polymerase sigma factor [Lachnospiraceae bacterium]|nr:sigma-70 family RNA polymerase sigma factor [Lachnospiraceae bacterium]
MELLVKKAKRGDAEAFIELIEQNKQSMYKVARGFLRDEEDVADAMAETVLICYEKIGTLRQSAYFKTWMIRILINQCKDMIRKQKKSLPIEIIPETESSKGEDGIREFRELIEPLKEKDRSIFTLYYVYGLKIKEIAEYMEMNENTVTSHLRRGKEALREEFTGAQKQNRR